jgi:membrane fusion protein
VDGTDLFRREAVEHSFASATGTTVLRIPRLAKWITVLFITSALLTSAILLSTEFAQKENVSGLLAPTLGMTRVTANITGTLKQIKVKPGEMIAAGQVLGVLSPESSGNGGKSAVMEQLAAVNSQKIEIAEQILSVKSQQESKLARFNVAIAGAKLELEALAEELKIRDEISARLYRQAEIGNTLAKKKLLPQRDAELRQNQLDDVKTQLAVLKREEARLKSTILQTESEIIASAKDLELAVSRFNVQSSELDAQISVLKGLTSTEIVSPASGIVDYIGFQSGQNAPSGSLLFSIVPEGSELRAELFIPSKAIANIKIGQQVRIEYDAFPSEHYGYANAKLYSLNQTVLDPAEAKTYGANVQTPVYRLFANLSEQGVKKELEQIKLRAGMTFSAQIVVEKHRLYVWAWRSLSRAWLSK